MTVLPAKRKLMESVCALSSSGMSQIIAIHSLEERQHIVRGLKQLVKSKNVEGFSFIQSDSFESKDIEDANEFTLFNQPKVLVYHISSMLNEKNIQELLALTKEFKVSAICLVCPGVSNKVNVKELASHFKIYNTTNEKPWEKTTRYVNEISQLAKDLGYTFELQAASRLAEQFGSDYAAMLNEVEKCILFANRERYISGVHLDALSNSILTTKLWDVAEELAWGITQEHLLDSLSDQEYYSLLGQLRFRYTIGLGVKNGTNPTTISQRLQKKYIFEANKWPRQYFIVSLLKLQDLETVAKTASHRSGFLSTMLFYSIKKIQDTYRGS